MLVAAAVALIKFKMNEFAVLTHPLWGFGSTFFVGCMCMGRNLKKRYSELLKMYTRAVQFEYS